MAEITDVANALFTNKQNWTSITDEDKEKYFFIFNRYFSKKYPEQAQLLNLKSINKVSAFDTWYYFMINKPYPKWFWSKSKKKTDKLTNEDRLMMEQFSLDRMSMDFLKENFEQEYKQELKLIKTRQKNGKK